MYSFGTGNWNTVNDYPGSGPYPGVCSYDMLYIPETRSYLVIGGDDGSGNDEVSQIFKFEDGIWYDVGRLNSGRNVKFCSFLFISQLMIQFKGTQRPVVWQLTCCRWWIKGIFEWSVYDQWRLWQVRLCRNHANLEWKLRWRFICSPKRFLRLRNSLHVTELSKI